jgi:large subunit ribosomal protein L25
MQTQTIKATRREVLGTKAARRLRKHGLIPAIIYSREGKPEPISLPAHEVEVSLQHSSHILQLEVDGTEKAFLVKEAQFDYLGSHLAHLDLAQVNIHEVVEIKVPVELRGTPVGLSEGGVLDQVMKDLAIRCKVTDIPSSIRLNIGQMKLGQTLCIRDIELPAGVQVVGEPEEPVVAVRALMEEAAPAAAEAEGPAEPEVIGRKEKEEEEAAEGEKA